MQRDLVLLDEMIEATERIRSLCHGVSGAELENDRLRRDAVFWNFTVLGETAGQLSAKLRSTHAGVERRKPIELRHRIVHGYWSIDTAILVATAEDDLPGFSTRFEPSAIRSTADPRLRNVVGGRSRPASRSTLSAASAGCSRDGAPTEFRAGMVVNR
jgi:uncharacterized protein with HEPN domain